MTTMGGPMVITTPLTPASGGYTIDMVSTHNMAAPRTGATVKLVLTTSAGAAWEFVIDSATPKTQTLDASGAVAATGTTYDEADLQAFFKLAGLDETDSTVSAEIKELALLTTVQVLSPYVSPTTAKPPKNFTTGFVNTSWPGGAAAGPPTVAIISMFAVPLVLFVVWIGGIIFIVLRRGRLMREMERVGPPGAAVPA